MKSGTNMAIIEKENSIKSRNLKRFADSEGRKYLEFRTHLYNKDKSVLCSALPSVSDIIKYNLNENSEGLSIAQKDAETGKVMGYTTIFGKKLPKKEFLEISPANYVHSIYSLSKNDRYASVPATLDSLKKLLSKYKERIRFQPARGYAFNKETGNYEKKNMKLEKIIVSSMIGFAFIFLLSNNLSIPSLTGNVINSGFKSSISIFSIIGFFLLFIAFIVLFIAEIRKISGIKKFIKQDRKR